MHYSHSVWAGLLSLGLISPVFANDLVEPNEALPASTVAVSSTAAFTAKQLPQLKAALQELKNVKTQDLKVNASADQPESQKDPLQLLNRQVYAFNDVLDRNIARPLAVQYKQKVPADIRDSYHQFRKNLGEPWNAVNQLIQGRPLRATKSLGRFAINTLTTLGLADPALHLGLTTEDEKFGMTLGYYGIPSGPYVVLPIFGPSTFLDSIGMMIDSQGRLQKYIFEDKEGLYWTEQSLRGLDARSQILDIEDVLQGDKYAAIRDIYLQRKNFAIAEKKGLESENLFINDDFDELGNDVDVPEDNVEK